MPRSTLRTKTLGTKTLGTKTLGANISGAPVARGLVAGLCCCLSATAGAAEPAYALLARHLAQSAYLAPAAPDEAMRVALVLQLANPAGAAVYAEAVSTPGNPLRGHYLTPAAFRLRFGTPQAAIDAVRSWAAAHGLTAGVPVGGAALIPLTGTAAAMQAAFGVHLNRYRAADGHDFIAPDAAPHLPAEIASSVYAVAGLDGHTRFAPLVLRNPGFRLHAGAEGSGAKGAGPLGAGGTGPGGAYGASDLRAAYGIPAPLSPSQPQTVAIFEAGGFDPHDVATYESRNRLPIVPIAVRGVNCFGGGIIDLNIEVESLLDVDMVRATNPAAHIIVYEDGVSATFDLALTSALAAMAADDSAQTVSISYGEDEYANPPEEPYLVQLAAQGEAVFASSGDNGAFGDGSGTTYALIHPSSSPLVTSVGGTTLYTGPHQAYAGEDVWNELADGRGATGGGVSAVWPIPAWQVGSEVTLSNEASTTMRNSPDVAAVGNPFTGVAVYCTDAGGWVQVGGTSVAAPIWAGFYSLLGAAHAALGLGAPGFSNPTIYAADSTTYDYYDHDVTNGTNGGAYGLPGFSAASYYDNVSGWGSINGPHTLQTLFAIPVDPSVPPPAQPTGFTATLNGNTASFTWRSDRTATGYVLESEILNPNYRPSIFVTPNFVVTAGLSASVTGLQPGTLYHFELNAVNRGGETTGPLAILSVPSTP